MAPTTVSVGVPSNTLTISVSSTATGSCSM